MQRVHELAPAAKSGHHPGHRATLDLMRSRLGPKARGLSTIAELLIRSCGRNGVWTAGRGRLAGCETDGRCVCGQ
eukprot:5666917-Pyramimonas_sp.AAC.1